MSLFQLFVPSPFDFQVIEKLYCSNHLKQKLISDKFEEL